MKEKRLLALALAVLILGCAWQAASAQPVDCVELTGRSGHLIFPAGVWQGTPDTVRAFGPQGDCVGEGTISAAPSALTMWGFDDLAHQYQGKGGLRAGDPIALASSGGALAVRLRADQPYLSKRLVWSDDMIAVAAMVAPADSLFMALDSLEAAVQALAQDRAALAQQVQAQADQIVSLQQSVQAITSERDDALAALGPLAQERDSLALAAQALIGERDAALALLAPVRAERDSLAQVAEALETERAELAIRVDEQATTIESATQRVRLILEGMR